MVWVNDRWAAQNRQEFGTPVLLAPPFGWPAHTHPGVVSLGLVPRYPLQKPPSRGLEGSGGEGGGGTKV